MPTEATDDDPRLRDALEYREQLRQAIADNPSGHTFSESPLMLTVLAVVHWSDKQLPEERAELYDRAVKYLIDKNKALSGFQPLPFQFAQGVKQGKLLDGREMPPREGRSRREDRDFQLGSGRQ